MDKVNIVDPQYAIASLRESDFDTASAVGEVLDNSVQAGATEIHVRTEERELPVRGRRKEGVKTIVEMAFGDNGCGMDAQTLHRCMQLGFSTRYNDRGGIGRFGVGVTLAAINQCKRIDVYSNEKGGAWLYTYVDLDELERDPHIPTPERKKLPKAYADLVAGPKGTLVIWSCFDRSTQSEEAELEHWVARTYRKFIGERVVRGGLIVENESPIVMTINGKRIEAFDPLYAVLSADAGVPEGEHAELFEEIRVDMPVPDDAQVRDKVSTITIQMSLTPEAWRPRGGAGGGALAQGLRIPENEGFSVLRAGREVFYDAMPHFRPAVHGDGYDRWWSAEILFEPTLDRYFSVRNVKRGARFLRELREKIQKLMGPTISECRRQVKATFDANRTKDIREGTDVTTEHTEAERAVKTAKPTPGKAGAQKSEQEKKREIENIIKPLAKTQQELEAWRAKIDEQPCTIVDHEGTTWKGDTFIDIHPFGGRTVIEYNMGHALFMFVYEVMRQLESAKDSSEPREIVAAAKRLKTAIDLLFMAYAQASALFDPDHVQKTGDTLGQLLSNWGVFVRQYLNTYEKTSSG